MNNEPTDNNKLPESSTTLLQSTSAVGKKLATFRMNEIPSTEEDSIWILMDKNYLLTYYIDISGFIYSILQTLID